MFLRIFIRIAAYDIYGFPYGASRARFTGNFEYIAFELSSMQNAVGQLSRLEKAIESLDIEPERFARVKKEPWFSRGLRVMPVDNYCVLYLPGLDRHCVNVLRVGYGGADMDALLCDMTGQ